MDDLTPPDTAEMRRLADEGYEPADLRRSLRRAADWIDAALAAAGEPQPPTDEWRCCNVATCPECNPVAAGAAPSTPQTDELPHLYDLHGAISARLTNHQDPRQSKAASLDRTGWGVWCGKDEAYQEVLEVVARQIDAARRVPLSERDRPAPSVPVDQPATDGDERVERLRRGFLAAGEPTPDPGAES